MSNKDDFIDQVQAHLPPNLGELSSQVPEFVAALAETNLIRWDYPKQDVANVIGLMSRLLASGKGKERRVVREGKLNAHALLTADHLAESLRPKIVAIRKAYFGSEDAPFPSQQAAEEWVSVYDSGQLFLPKEEAERWRSVFEAKYRSFEWTFAGDLSYDMTLAFWTWDEVMHEVLELSDTTGISPSALQSYVLADIKPLQTPYEITMPGQEFCRGKRKCWSVDIKVNTELGFDDLFEIHRIVKEALGTKKGKRLNDKHLQLYTMVQERGGAPSGKGSVKFWQSLLQEWNDKYEGEYREWRCIKRAYDRLCDRLNAQYETKEARHEN